MAVFEICKALFFVSLTANLNPKLLFDQYPNSHSYRLDGYKTKSRLLGSKRDSQIQPYFNGL